MTARLAAYQPMETDPLVDAELRRLILDGMHQQSTLPAIPAHVGSSQMDERTHRAAERAARRQRRTK